MGNARPFRNLLFAFSLLSLVSCGLTSRDQTSLLLDDVASYINERPDSAQAVLATLDSAALNTRALRARYALLNTMARDKCYMDITIPGLLAPAERYYERHGSPDERMKTLYYRGRIAQDNNDRNAAAVFFSRAEEYADDVTDKHALGVLYMAQASVFNQAHNTKKEKEYITKGLGVFHEINDPMHDIALGQLAISCFTLREWDRADSLFAVGIAAASDNPYTMSNFLSNYARMKVSQPEPEPEMAINLLDQMRNEYGYPLSLRDAGAYAYALTLSGRTSEAKKLLPQLEQLAETSPLELDPWLCRCALTLGDYEKAYYFLNQSHLSEEAEIQGVLADSVTDAISSYQELTASQRRMKYRINLYALSAILLLLALALVLARLRRIRLEEERSRMQAVCAILEKEVAEQENRTEHLQQQLMHFREIARQERVRRFRQAGKLRSSIWRLDQGLPAWFKKDPSISAIKEELSYVYDIDDSGEKLLQRLDRELDGVIVPLMEKLNMQDKSQDQLFLCCCLLDLPSDVVGAKLGITPNNVRVKRHRLRDQIAKLNNADYDALFDIHK